MPSQRVAFLVLFSLILLIPFASAQIATEPICKTCFPNDCYSYKDCKPVEKQSCKTGYCCEGTCITVNASADAKVNFIGDQMIAVMKYFDSMDRDISSLSKPSMTMHGTEYTVGDRAKVWLQAVDSAGKYLNTASCYLSVYYPHGTTLINNAPMSLLDNGIYYYDIIVPDVVGVYPAIGLCYYSTAKQEETADAGYILNGTTGGGSYTTTATKNNAYWNIDEASVNGTQRIAVGLNYTSVSSLIGLTEVDFNFQGRWNGGTDFITIYFYNWTSATWQALPNTIPDTGAVDLDVSNSIFTNNATISGIRKDGNVFIQFRDTTGADVTSSRLRIDYMAVDLLNLSGDKATEIKGSSEIHAKADLLSSSNYLDVQTTCGMVDILEADSCGSIVNYDDEMNFLEKEIEVNITATSLSSENDTPTSWEYLTPISQDCTSIYQILHYNGTGWEDVTSTVDMHSRMADENCHMIVPLITNVGQTDYYRIIMDNYLLWEVQWTWAMANLSRSLLTPECLLYGIQYNYTFDVPITEDTAVNYSNNRLYSCHKLFDDLYYIDYYANLSEQATTVAELTSYYVEVVWYQAALRHQLQMVDFIIDYNDFLMGMATTPYAIWNYSNRTLTDYNQTLMWSLMSANNQSLYDHITGMQLSLSNQISAVNQSMSSLLTSSNEEIMAKLADVLGNVTEVQNELYDQRILLEYVNSSMKDRFDSVDSQLSSIDGKIDDLETLIYDVNVSILNKLYLMQDEIASVNNTVLAGNAELMAAIISTNSTLVSFLWNISNITANITIAQEEILTTLIALWDSSGGKEVNMAGFTGLLTGLANNVQYFCADNVTLRSITTEVVNISGKIIPIERTKDVICTGGCVQDSCAIPDYSIYLLLLGITVFAYLAYRFYFKHDDSNQEY